MIGEDDVGLNSKGHRAEEAGGFQGGGGVEIVPGGEGKSAGGGAGCSGEKPLGEGDEGTALGGFAIVNCWGAPADVGGLLLVADEAVAPGVGDGDLQMIGAGFDGIADIDAEGRIPEDAEVVAV